MNISTAKGFLKHQYEEEIPVKTASENLIFAAAQEYFERPDFQKGFQKGLEEIPDNLREKVASIITPKVVIPLTLSLAASPETAMGQEVLKALENQ